MNRFIEEMMSRWWPFYQPLAALPSYTWEKVEEKKIEERRALESHNTEYFTKIQNDATVSGGKKSVCVCVPSKDSDCLDLQYFSGLKQ